VICKFSQSELADGGEHRNTDQLLHGVTLDLTVAFERLKDA
jgi:hypothetical protein